MSVVADGVDCKYVNDLLIIVELGPGPPGRPGIMRPARVTAYGGLNCVLDGATGGNGTQDWKAVWSGKAVVKKDVSGVMTKVVKIYCAPTSSSDGIGGVYVAG